jgi:hypothetical protein
MPPGYSPKKVIAGYQKCKLLRRVARWFVFKPKIPIWVNFGRP